jgi:nucleoprotein TPR
LHDLGTSKFGTSADLAQSVEGRLVEENRALSMERSHLSDLMANVQKMHNDIERSSENDRRRLESQIQLLENQRFEIFAFLTT